MIAVHDAMLTPVILAGGAGERLWPVSTPAAPKQFIIHGPDGLTLFQAAVMRGRAVAPDAKPVIVCAAHHERLVRAQLKAFGDMAAELIVEPHARNTAPAITLAALHLAQRAPNGVMLVLPSDHHIEHEAVFARSVASACNQASQGNIVLFGIRPTRAATEYGYIQLGDSAGSDTGILHVRRFVEKPPVGDAQDYLDAGDYVWNSGIFLMSTQAALQQLRHAAPKIATACQVAYTQAKTVACTIYPDANSYAIAPRLSFDQAVLESAQPVLVSVLDIGWDDLGSWGALERFHKRYAAIKTTASDESASAILASSEESRPWGRFVAIDEGGGYKVKKLYIECGRSLSLQVHEHRSEHWVVVQGTATVICGERTFTLRSNESTFIASGQRHQLRNDHAELLVIIEVQVGGLISEEDITRFEMAAL